MTDLDDLTPDELAAARALPMRDDDMDPIARAALADFGDLSDYLTRDEDDPAKAKALPWDGQVWEFPRTLSGRGWLLAQKVRHALQGAAYRRRHGEPVDVDMVVLTDAEEAQLAGEVLGDTVDDLVAAGADGEVLDHMMMTLLTWHLVDRDAAIAVWKGGKAPGEAGRPGNRAARRAAGRSRRTG